MKRFLIVGALALSAVFAVCMIPQQSPEPDDTVGLTHMPDLTVSAVADIPASPVPDPADAPIPFELLGLAAVAGATKKKTAAKKAAKTAKASEPNAADKAVADKVAAKAKKDGGQAVYRLDQGESLPGPDPE